MYLDNAATSYPKPESVYEAVNRTMRLIGASPGRGGYRQSLEAGRILYAAREAAASLFSLPDSSQVIFTHNATSALNLAIHGVLKAGDHVISTSMEHNSLLRPLYAQQQKGVELTIVGARPDGVVDIGDVRRAIRTNTRMIAVSHVSNVCGAIQPIFQLSELCRESGALFLVDAAQSAGHLPLDISGLGVDLLAVPGHKGLLGPGGTGLLYVAPHVALSPVTQGGTGSHSTAYEQPLIMPEGFEAGTHNISGISGLLAGIEFLLEHGVVSVGHHIQELLRQLETSLKTISGLTVYGPDNPSHRCSVLSFTVADVDPGELAALLDREFDIAVRSGLHCAPQAHRTIGTYPAGSVRVSPGNFTTPEEIAFFSDAVVQCVNEIRKSSC